MVLAVDVGNSNIVFGIKEKKEWILISRICTERKWEADQYAAQIESIFNMYHINATCFEGVIISTVVPELTRVLTQAFKTITTQVPYVLTIQDILQTGFMIDIENPQEMGTDSASGAVAVAADYALPAVLIDMGTATKIAGVDKDGVLRGVAIAAGLSISLSALVGNTSLLSGIQMNAPKSAIGRNTTQSMQSGVVFGTASMLDGMIDRFEEELGTIKTVVATGGMAQFVTPYCKRNIQICDTLLLEGLYKIYRSVHS